MSLASWRNILNSLVVRPPILHFKAAADPKWNVFDPDEFANAVPSTFTIAGALFTRITAEIDDGEVELLLSLIRDLRMKQLDPLNPPSWLYSYLISALQYYEEKTMASVDQENDLEVEAAVDGLARYRALRRHYTLKLHDVGRNIK